MHCAAHDSATFRWLFGIFMSSSVTRCPIEYDNGFRSLIPPLQLNKNCVDSAIPADGVEFSAISSVLGGLFTINCRNANDDSWVAFVVLEISPIFTNQLSTPNTNILPQSLSLNMGK